MDSCGPHGAETHKAEEGTQRLALEEQSDMEFEKLEQTIELLEECVDDTAMTDMLLSNDTINKVLVWLLGLSSIRKNAGKRAIRSEVRALKVLARCSTKQQYRIDSGVDLILNILCSIVYYDENESEVDEDLNELLNCRVEAAKVLSRLFLFNKDDCTVPCLIEYLLKLRRRGEEYSHILSNLLVSPPGVSYIGRMFKTLGSRPEGGLRHDQPGERTMEEKIFIIHCVTTFQQRSSLCNLLTSGERGATMLDFMYGAFVLSKYSSAHTNEAPTQSTANTTTEGNRDEHNNSNMAGEGEAESDRDTLILEIIQLLLKCFEHAQTLFDVEKCMVYQNIDFLLKANGIERLPSVLEHILLWYHKPKDKNECGSNREKMFEKIATLYLDFVFVERTVVMPKLLNRVLLLIFHGYEGGGEREKLLLEFVWRLKKAVGVPDIVEPLRQQTSSANTQSRSSSPSPGPSEVNTWSNSCPPETSNVPKSQTTFNIINLGAFGVTQTLLMFYNHLRKEKQGNSGTISSAMLDVIKVIAESYLTVDDCVAMLDVYNHDGARDFGANPPVDNDLLGVLTDVINVLSLRHSLAGANRYISLTHCVTGGFPLNDVWTEGISIVFAYRLNRSFGSNPYGVSPMSASASMTSVCPPLYQVSSVLSVSSNSRPFLWFCNKLRGETMTLCFNILDVLIEVDAMTGRTLSGDAFLTNTSDAIGLKDEASESSSFAEQEGNSLHTTRDTTELDEVAVSLGNTTVESPKTKRPKFDIFEFNHVIVSVSNASAPTTSHSQPDPKQRRTTFPSDGESMGQQNVLTSQNISQLKKHASLGVDIYINGILVVSRKGIKVTQGSETCAIGEPTLLGGDLFSGALGSGATIGSRRSVDGISSSVSPDDSVRSQKLVTSITNIDRERSGTSVTSGQSTGIPQQPQPSQQQQQQRKDIQSGVLSLNETENCVIDFASFSVYRKAIAPIEAYDEYLIANGATLFPNTLDEVVSFSSVNDTIINDASDNMKFVDQSKMKQLSKDRVCYDRCPTNSKLGWRLGQCEYLDKIFEATGCPRGSTTPTDSRGVPSLQSFGDCILAMSSSLGGSTPRNFQGRSGPVQSMSFAGPLVPSSTGMLQQQQQLQKQAITASVRLDGVWGQGVSSLPPSSQYPSSSPTNRSIPHKSKPGMTHANFYPHSVYIHNTFQTRSGNGMNDFTGLRHFFLTETNEIYPSATHLSAFPDYDSFLIRELGREQAIRSKTKDKLQLLLLDMSASHWARTPSYPIKTNFLDDTPELFSFGEARNNSKLNTKMFSRLDVSDNMGRFRYFTHNNSTVSDCWLETLTRCPCHPVTVLYPAVLVLRSFMEEFLKLKDTLATLMMDKPSPDTERALFTICHLIFRLSLTDSLNYSTAQQLDAYWRILDLPSSIYVTESFRSLLITLTASFKTSHSHNAIYLENPSLLFALFTLYRRLVRLGTTKAALDEQLFEPVGLLRETVSKLIPVLPQRLLAGIVQLATTTLVDCGLVPGCNTANNQTASKCQGKCIGSLCETIKTVIRRVYKQTGHISYIPINGAGTRVDKVRSGSLIDVLLDTLIGTLDYNELSLVPTVRERVSGLLIDLVLDMHAEKSGVFPNNSNNTDSPLISYHLFHGDAEKLLGNIYEVADYYIRNVHLVGTETQEVQRTRDQMSQASLRKANATSVGEADEKGEEKRVDESVWSHKTSQLALDVDSIIFGIGSTIYFDGEEHAKTGKLKGKSSKKLEKELKQQKGNNTNTAKQGEAARKRKPTSSCCGIVGLEENGTESYKGSFVRKLTVLLNTEKRHNTVLDLLLLLYAISKFVIIRLTHYLKKERERASGEGFIQRMRNKHRSTKTTDHFSFKIKRLLTESFMLQNALDLLNKSNVVVKEPPIVDEALGTEHEVILSPQLVLLSFLVSSHNSVLMLINQCVLHDYSELAFALTSSPGQPCAFTTVDNSSTSLKEPDETEQTTKDREKIVGQRTVIEKSLLALNTNLLINTVAWLVTKLVEWTYAALQQEVVVYIRIQRGNTTQDAEVNPRINRREVTAMLLASRILLNVLKQITLRSGPAFMDSPILFGSRLLVTKVPVLLSRNIYVILAHLSALLDLVTLNHSLIITATGVLDSTCDASEKSANATSTSVSAEGVADAVFPPTAKAEQVRHILTVFTHLAVSTTKGTRLRQSISWLIAAGTKLFGRLTVLGSVQGIPDPNKLMNLLQSAPQAAVLRVAGAFVGAVIPHCSAANDLSAPPQSAALVRQLLLVSKGTLCAQVRQRLIESAFKSLANQKPLFDLLNGILPVVSTALSGFDPSAEIVDVFETFLVVAVVVWSCSLGLDPFCSYINKIQQKNKKKASALVSFSSSENPTTPPTITKKGLEFLATQPRTWGDLRSHSELVLNLIGMSREDTILSTSDNNAVSPLMEQLVELMSRSLRLSHSLLVFLEDSPSFFSVTPALIDIMRSKEPEDNIVPVKALPLTTGFALANNLLLLRLLSTAEVPPLHLLRNVRVMLLATAAIILPLAGPGPLSLSSLQGLTEVILAVLYTSVEVAVNFLAAVALPRHAQIGLFGLIHTVVATLCDSIVAREGSAMEMSEMTSLVVKIAEHSNAALSALRLRPPAPAPPVSLPPLIDHIVGPHRPKDPLSQSAARCLSRILKEHCGMNLKAFGTSCLVQTESAPVSTYPSPPESIGEEAIEEEEEEDQVDLEGNNQQEQQEQSIGTTETTQTFNPESSTNRWYTMGEQAFVLVQSEWNILTLLRYIDNKARCKQGPQFEERPSKHLVGNTAKPKKAAAVPVFWNSVVEYGLAKTVHPTVAGTVIRAAALTAKRLVRDRGNIKDGLVNVQTHSQILLDFANESSMFVLDSRASPNAEHSTVVRKAIHRLPVGIPDMALNHVLSLGNAFTDNVFKFLQRRHCTTVASLTGLPLDNDVVSRLFLSPIRALSTKLSTDINSSAPPGIFDDHVREYWARGDVEDNRSIDQISFSLSDIRRAHPTAFQDNSACPHPFFATPLPDPLLSPGLLFDAYADLDGCVRDFADTGRVILRHILVSKATLAHHSPHSSTGAHLLLLQFALDYKVRSRALDRLRIYQAMKQMQDDLYSLGNGELFSSRSEASRSDASRALIMLDFDLDSHGDGTTTGKNIDEFDSFQRYERRVAKTLNTAITTSEGLRGLDIHAPKLGSNNNDTLENTADFDYDPLNMEDSLQVEQDVQDISLPPGAPDIYFNFVCLIFTYYGVSACECIVTDKEIILFTDPKALHVVGLVSSEFVRRAIALRDTVTQPAVTLPQDILATGETRLVEWFAEKQLSCALSSVRSPMSMVIDPEMRERVGTLVDLLEAEPNSPQVITIPLEAVSALVTSIVNGISGGVRVLTLSGRSYSMVFDTEWLRDSFINAVLSTESIQTTANETKSQDASRATNQVQLPPGQQQRNPLLPNPQQAPNPENIVASATPSKSFTIAALRKSRLPNIEYIPSLRDKVVHKAVKYFERGNMSVFILLTILNNLASRDQGISTAYHIFPSPVKLDKGTVLVGASSNSPQQLSAGQQTKSTSTPNSVGKLSESPNNSVPTTPLDSDTLGKGSAQPPATFVGDTEGAKQEPILRFRDFSFPAFVQNESVRARVLKTGLKDGLGPIDGPYFVVTAPSTGYGTTYFMVRLDPYSSNTRLIQSGKFDESKRVFNSADNIISADVTSLDDGNFELIPELYTTPEIFLNLNHLQLKSRRPEDNRGKDSNLVSDGIEIPEPIGDCYTFVEYMRAFLESPYVRQNILHWVDLFFGVFRRDQTRCSYYINAMYNEQDADTLGKIRQQDMMEEERLRAKRAKAHQGASESVSGSQLKILSGAQTPLTGRVKGKGMKRDKGNMLADINQICTGDRIHLYEKKFGFGVLPDRLFTKELGQSAQLAQQHAMGVAKPVLSLRQFLNVPIGSTLTPIGLFGHLSRYKPVFRYILGTTTCSLSSKLIADTNSFRTTMQMLQYMDYKVGFKPPMKRSSKKLVGTDPEVIKRCSKYVSYIEQNFISFYDRWKVDTISNRFLEGSGVAKTQSSNQERRVKVKPFGCLQRSHLNGAATTCVSVYRKCVVGERNQSTGSQTHNYIYPKTYRVKEACADHCAVLSPMGVTLHFNGMRLEGLSYERKRQRDLFVSDTFDDSVRHRTKILHRGKQFKLTKGPGGRLLVRDNPYDDCYTHSRELNEVRNIKSQYRCLFSLTDNCTGTCLCPLGTLLLIGTDCNKVVAVSYDGTLVCSIPIRKNSKDSSSSSSSSSTTTTSTHRTPINSSKGETDPNNMGSIGNSTVRKIHDIRVEGGIIYVLENTVTHFSVVSHIIVLCEKSLN